MARMVDGPLKSLDQQIASIGNTVTGAIQSHYGDKPNDIEIITNPTQLLSRRYPASEIEMPKKGCNLGIDFLDTSNDFNLDKQIKSMSLDPIMRRLIQEKNAILRSIEGWVASQANDGARQPLLAKTIVTWIKKAVGFMRCGMQLIRQINQLINGTISAILGVIGSIEDQLASDLRAIAMLQDQFSNLDKKMKAYGMKLLSIAAINFLQDYLALYNELASMEKELKQMKAQYSKSHLNAMKVSLINSFLVLIEDFKRLVGKVQKNKAVVVRLKASIISLQKSLDDANSIDLSIPMNPGGVNPGALSNYTVTNAPAIFADFDSLTKNTDINTWNTAEITALPPGFIANWTDIFTSNESGYLVVASNNYGLFQFCLDKTTQITCPGAAIMVRMIINGGDWIIEAISTGDILKDHDDSSIDNYTTKNGVFIKVPESPNPNMRLKSNFDEFIRANNRPASLVTGQFILDPYFVYDPVNPLATGLRVIPEKDSNYVLSATVTPVSDWTTLTLDQWLAINENLYRYPMQDEIDFYENQYNVILQALNINPDLYINPYRDQTNPLYNPLFDPQSPSYNIHYATPGDPLFDPHSVASDLAIDLGTDIHGDPIVIHFKMPNDTQLRQNLLGKRPFGGISIFTKSINLQIARQSSSIINMPFFAFTGDSFKDDHVVNFGFKADWGFAPISLLS
jgi:cell division protein ZapA (FtsZ GTPase activity inhibitor)